MLQQINQVMNDQKCKKNGISGMHIILNVSHAVRQNERGDEYGMLFTTYYGRQK